MQENLQENTHVEVKSFIEITLRHGCSTLNLLHIFRTAFPKNTSGGLLLLLPWSLKFMIFKKSETWNHQILKPSSKMKGLKKMLKINFWGDSFTKKKKISFKTKCFLKKLWLTFVAISFNLKSVILNIN